jgi:DNA-binding NarL/FixJ family response regulator
LVSAIDKGFCKSFAPQNLWSMAQKPIAMEQLKQVLQLQKDGISIREIARRTGISRNSVRKYLSRLSVSEG